MKADNNSSNQLESVNFFKDKEAQLLEYWLKEICDNPRYACADVAGKENLKSRSREFLARLLNTLETRDIPEFSSKALEPLFQLWHSILREQGQKGFTTKDTAMLIFSLKTSIINFIQEYYSQKDGYIPQVRKFGNLLDLLGLFTFEVYTAEKESLISRQHEQIHYLQASNEGYDQIVGNSPQMNMVYKAIGLILENDIAVLLEGESGTGKDLIADIIHKNSKRKNMPFVVLNCGAIPKELIESELFGHEKGAFTGADIKRTGKFELAHGGTLFLDEVGELPLDMQVRLLRVLQNKEIERVGGTEKIKVDVRIIAATNIDLKSAVDNNKFRLDLYYRLNIYPIHIPPLRERKSDILQLADYFLEKYSAHFKINKAFITNDARESLLTRRWEGNVRELENLIQRAVILAQGQVITATLLDLKPGQIELKSLPEAIENKGDLSKDVFSIEEDKLISLEEAEKYAVKRAVRLTNGNISKSAKGLGISRTALYQKMNKYKINDRSVR